LQALNLENSHKAERTALALRCEWCSLSAFGGVGEAKWGEGSGEVPHFTTHFRRRFAGSKLNWLVELATLGAAGTVHIRVVRIDQTAFAAAKNAVFWVGRAEAPPMEFREYPHSAHCAERQRHVNDE
jgi:hypothetical protein